VLESILDLGPLPASRGGLFERGCALFRGKGRKSHAYVTSDVDLVGYGPVRNLVAPHLGSHEQHACPFTLRRRLAAKSARVSENSGKVLVSLHQVGHF
jgi:hypothetical protein